MSLSTSHRLGFTLVELLVVIAIIGILMALLVPAVSGVREAGRQTQCKNQLREIATAAGLHVNQHGHYPTGGWGRNWVGDPDRGFGPEQPGGWIYNSLPYLGFDNVRRIGASGTVKLDEAKKRLELKRLKAFVLPTFICPSRRRAVGYKPSETSYNADQPDEETGVAKTDYASNGGTGGVTGSNTTSPEFRVYLGSASRTCIESYPNCTFPNGSQSSVTNYLTSRFDGITYYLSQITPAQVRDGLGRTAYASEKWIYMDNYFSNPSYDNNTLYQGHDNDITRFFRAGNLSSPGNSTYELLPLSDAKDSKDVGRQNYDQYRFGSAHPNGVNVVFCDATVNTVAFTVDAIVWEHMGNRNDAGRFRGQLRTDSDTP